MLLQLLETPAAAARRPLALFHICLVLFALVLFGVDIADFGAALASGQHVVVDFDAFYLAGKLAWAGEAGRTYDYASFFTAMQHSFGTTNFLPWTYPPPFALLAAGLAIPARGWSYAVFTGVSLVGFLIVLRALAAGRATLVMLLLYAPILVTIKCGQNGFLTGLLVGLGCLGLLRQPKGPGWAGVPLGLMIIKPHLVLGIGIYLVVRRRWDVALVALAVAAALCGVATLAFGGGIWAAFRLALEQSQGFLGQGRYPLYRMVSLYAAMRSAGLAAPMAMAVQGVSALVVVGAVVAAGLRLSARNSLGLAVIASLLISPYGYDYDLPVIGIGLALLLPDVLHRASRFERGALYGAILAAGAFGLVQSTMWLRLGLVPPSEGVRDLRLTLAGPLLAAAFALLFHILRRDALGPDAAVPQAVTPAS